MEVIDMESNQEDIKQYTLLKKINEHHGINRQCLSYC